MWRTHSGGAYLCQEYLAAIMADVFVSFWIVMASASQWAGQLVCDNHFKFVFWQ